MRLIYVSGRSGSGALSGRLFRDSEDGWQTLVAASLADTARLMAETSFEVLLLEAERATPEEVQFLKETELRHPRTHRLVLSRLEDPSCRDSWSGAPAEFLSWQSAPGTVESAIRRALLLDRWLQDEGLSSLVRQIRRLPSRPLIYNEILKELRSPGRGLEQVAMWVATDPALCAKVLQVANSAAYARPLEAVSAFEAVMVLGLEVTASLVLFAELVAVFDSSRGGTFSIDRFWYHCMGTATQARRIAQAESDDGRVADEAYTAGLLHDVGKLMLAGSLPERYDEALELARQEGLALWEAERLTLGATHAELGACVLAQWGLPYAILEAMAWHHQPQQAPRKSFLPLAAVHVANLLGRQTPTHQVHVDCDYLKSIGRAEHLARWRQICGL